MVLTRALEVMEIGSYWNETVMEAVEVDTDFNSPLVISFDILMLELKCALVHSERWEYVSAEFHRKLCVQRSLLRV